MNYEWARRIASLKKRTGLVESDETGYAESFGVGSTIEDTPDGGMMLSLVITTDDVDLDGDIVDPRGADWEYWKQRKLPLYLEHQYGIVETVGRGRSDTLKMVPLGGGRQGWRVQAGLLKNDLGLAVAAYVREFGQIGSSIGFRIMDSRAPTPEESKRVGVDGSRARRTISAWAGLETSLTCNPCNTMAGGGYVAQSEKMLHNLDSLVSKGVITKSAAYCLGLPEQSSAKARNVTRVVIVP